MNYLPVSFLRWAPASAQQWFRHFHHHGRGDRHIWGWPVRGAGMYDGQILSQLKTKTWLTKGREDESRTEWPCGAPLEWFATCSSPGGRDSSEANEQYNTAAQKHPALSLLRLWTCCSLVFQQSHLTLLFGLTPMLTRQPSTALTLWWPHVILSSSSHLASCCRSPSHYWEG